MEAAVFMALLGAGYVASTHMSKKTEDGRTKENFVDAPSMMRPVLKAPMRAPTGELDIQYSLPTGGSIMSEPFPSDFRGLPTNYATQQDSYAGDLSFSASSGFAPQGRDDAVRAMVVQRTDNVEETPTYSKNSHVVSALSGVELPASEFTHNNMVPFFRGAPKQNMSDIGNKNILDSYTGAGSTQIAKKEQGPLFDIERGPVGNVYGLESHSDFMQDRIVGSKNRANEKPFEPIHVAPGLNEGFSSAGSGGYQQLEMQDFARPRGTDELRAANKPKVTFEGVTIAGKSVVGNRGQLGEVRKYAPDKFFLNEGGERNFAGVADNKRERMRSIEVLKHTARPETSQEHFGPAGAAEAKKEYQIPSFRAPMVSQFGEFGWRNADASTYFNKNTDAPLNDLGKAGIEIQPNERYFTGDRVMGLNVKPREGGEVALHHQDGARPTRKEETIANMRGAGNFGATAAGLPGRMTVYDPNDIARTTIKETTIDNDWIGIAAPANAPTKLTVYDPEDIARVTGRNTLAEPDKAMNVTLQGPKAPQLQAPDGMRYTQKGAISAKSSYTGVAASTEGKKARQIGAEKAMRHYGTKETVATGRKPLAGNGNLPLFNGEDNMNVSYRKLDADYVNDRIPQKTRLHGAPSGTEVLGQSRVRNPLMLDMSADRFNPGIISAIEENPYTVSLHKIGQ